MSTHKIADRYRKPKAAHAGVLSDKQKAAAPTNGKPPAAPEIYYEAPKKLFWSRNSEGVWTEYPSTQIRATLLQAGFSGIAINGHKLSELEQQFWTIRHHQDVSFAGEIAGYKQGVHTICGTRILVTRGPKLLVPKKGEWPLFKRFLNELLPNQTVYLLGWLKSSLQSLYHGFPFRPGQCLAIAGPNKCGKSFLQGILTVLFGGRCAKPFNFLSGETSHNGEMMSAEHLAIEDEANSTDTRSRRQFGARLKGLVANSVAYLNPKNRQALNIPPFWRVSITLNDEPENLMVLPPFDESISDKIILLRASRATFPFASDDLAAMARYRDSICAELPAFVDYLRTWKIPSTLIDQRFGVQAFHNQELLGQLQSLEPEYRLLELIETLQIWGIDGEPWEGTAAELRRQLEDKDRRGEVGRLLYYNTACGAYLARLRAKFPHRIEQKSQSNGIMRWRIHRQ